MRIWLDDERAMPDEFDTYCRTVEQAKDLLMQGKVDGISLDNDLGPGYTQGHELAKWIGDEAEAGRLARLDVEVHTGSPWVGKQMWRDIKRALHAWDNH